MVVVSNIQGNAVDDSEVDKNSSSTGQIGMLNQLLGSSVDEGKGNVQNFDSKPAVNEEDESRRQISLLNALVPEMEKPKTEAQRILETQKKQREVTREDKPKDSDSSKDEVPVRMIGLPRADDNLNDAIPKMLGMLGAKQIPAEDVQVMLKKVFTTEYFWVTSSDPGTMSDFMNDLGVLFRGNLRSNKSPAEIFTALRELLKTNLDDKYEMFMLPERADLISSPGQSIEQTEREDSRERVMFLVLPKDAAQAEDAPRWQYIASAILVLLTSLFALQVGVSAELPALPKEVLDFLASPEALQGLPPPGNFDVAQFVANALPVARDILAVSLAHEFGHRTVAWTKGIKLGPSFPVPNGQIGTFGSVTEIKSVINDRAEMFDLSASGPIVGMAVAAGLFITGILSSNSGDGAFLFPVPVELFRGSILLGGLARLGLGEAAMHSSQVLVSPSLIAGWCGFVTSALNLLPAGRLDGGRMTQAALGRGSLGVTSLLTYISLGLGILGSTLALPFGLFVLIFLRPPEKLPRDDVTKLDSARFTLYTVLIIIAVITLLPMGQGLSDEWGIGLSSSGVPPRDFF